VPLRLIDNQKPGVKGPGNTQVKGINKKPIWHSTVKKNQPIEKVHFIYAIVGNQIIKYLYILTFGCKQQQTQHEMD